MKNEKDFDLVSYYRQMIIDQLKFTLDINHIGERLDKIMTDTHDHVLKAKTTIFKKDLLNKLDQIKSHIINKTVEKNKYEVQSLIAQIRTDCREYKALDMNNKTLEAIQNGLIHDILQETTSLRDLIEALINGETFDPKYNQSYALYCEQLHLFHSDAAFNKLLNTALTELHNLKLQRNPKWKKSLFISYAWPSLENKKYEFWIQPFLQGLRYHLRLAGIKARLDFMDCEHADNIYEYMDSLKEDDCALLVGSNSLYNKHVNGTNSVDTELNHLRDKWKTSTNSGTKSVFLVSISGVFSFNFPKGYQWYQNVPDWRGISYLENLRTILCDLLQIKGNQDPDFLKIWAPIEEYRRAKKWPMQEQEVNQSLKTAKDAAEKWRTQPRNDTHLFTQYVRNEYTANSDKKVLSSATTSNASINTSNNAFIFEGTSSPQKPRPPILSKTTVNIKNDSFSKSFDECTEKLKNTIDFYQSTLVDALDSNKPYAHEGDNNLTTELAEMITQLNNIVVNLELASETENEALIMTFVYRCQTSLKHFNQKRLAYHNSMHAPLLAQICDQTQQSLDKVWQQIDIIGDHSKEEQKHRAKKEVLLIEQEYNLLHDEAINDSFEKLLADIKALDRPNKSSGKIEVYLLHAIDELSCFNEPWLKRFTAQLYEHLSSVDCSPVLYSKDKGRFSTKEGFFKQIRQIPHVCLLSTPCLKQQVEGKLIVDNSAWVKLLHKMKREPEGVQLIQLFGTTINNPDLLELANVSDWPSEGYFKGLKNLIAKLYFGNAHNEAYENLWQNFYNALESKQSMTLTN